MYKLGNQTNNSITKHHLKTSLCEWNRAWKQFLLCPKVNYCIKHDYYSIPWYSFSTCFSTVFLENYFSIHSQAILEKQIGKRIDEFQGEWNMYSRPLHACNISAVVITWKKILGLWFACVQITTFSSSCLPMTTQLTSPSSFLEIKEKCIRGEKQQ